MRWYAKIFWDIIYIYLFFCPSIIKIFIGEAAERMRSKTSRTLFFYSGQIFSLIKLQNKLAMLWIPFILIWIRIHFFTKFFSKRYNTQNQGWEVGAGRSRVFLAPWSRSRFKKKQEPEPLGKKSQEPEPLKNLPAPQPLEKIKSCTLVKKLYFSYSSLSKIVSFYG